MKINKIYTTTLVFLLLTNLVSFIRAQDSVDKHITILSFQEYLNQVRKKNLSYLSEKYNVNIADAEVIAQKVLPDPELTFEGANEYFSVGIGYTLELGNKRGARVRLAKSQADLEKLALEYYYQELRAEAADLYLDAIQQRELLNVRKSSYEYMLQLSKSDSIRFRLGEITEVDAMQSKLEATTLLNEVFEQEATYKSVLAKVNQYMGQTTLSFMNLSGKWSNIDRNYRLSELILTGLNNRIDLYAARKSIDVAINQQKLTKSIQKIDLGLSVSYERDWHGFLPPSRSVKAGVSVPLKFSNLNKGAIKAAGFVIEQAKIEKRNTELEIRTEISQAYFQFEAFRKKSKQYQTGLLKDAKTILDGIVYKYKRGESDITDVLIAQRTYNDVQELYLETMKGFASSLVTLQKVCGIWDISF